MSQKNNKKQGHKNQCGHECQRSTDTIMTPARMKICVQKIGGSDTCVTIPLSEYVSLISIVTNMNTVERWVKAHRSYEKIEFEELRLLMGIEDNG